MGEWDRVIERLKDLPTVSFSGEFETDESARDRHAAHMAVCKSAACAECGMAPCGEYHHLGPRGNGACTELWCPMDTVKG